MLPATPNARFVLGICRPFTKNGDTFRGKSIEFAKPRQRTRGRIGIWSPSGCFRVAFLGRFDLPGKSRRIFVQVFQWIPVTHIVGSQLLSFGFYMSGGSQVYQLSALDPWLLSVLLWDLGLTHQESASSSFRAFKGALGLPTNRWH